MDKIISRMAKRFLQKSEVRIVMIGLDSLGKATILYKLKLGQTVGTIPTIGFNVEYKNVSFAVWDVGGRNKIRPLWKYYFQNTHGLIFVVDSNDRQRILEARNELHNIPSYLLIQTCLMRPFPFAELRSAMLLVFANKQDLPDTMSVNEMAHKPGLYSLLHRRWNIQSTSAISGQGLYQGLDWLLKDISKEGL